MSPDSMIVYNYKIGWRITRDPLDDEDYVAGITPPDYREFDRSVILDSRFERFSRSPNLEGCIIWIGPKHQQYSLNPAPFYCVPLGTNYPQQLHIPVRRLLLSAALNIDYFQFPTFRISMHCETPLCITPSHTIPAELQRRDRHRRTKVTERQRLSTSKFQAELDAGIVRLKEKGWLAPGDPGYDDAPGGTAPKRDIDTIRQKEFISEETSKGRTAQEIIDMAYGKKNDV